MRNIILVLLFLISLSCGKRPAELLRLQQAYPEDFPIYATVGDGTGRIWQIERDGTKTEFTSGLSDPQGLATDGRGSLYVVEQGTSRLLRYDLASKVQTVVAMGLSVPTTVAIDSKGEVYVNEEGANRIRKISDSSIFASFSNSPSAFIFGLADQAIVGFFNINTTYWGLSGATQFTIQKPIAMAKDILGRIYVSEGTDSGSRIIRIGPTPSDSSEVIVNGLNGAFGVIIDRSGNLFVAETAESRIVFVTQNNQLFKFVDLTAPLYLTMTRVLE